MTVLYETGEILERILNKASFSSEANALDAILYIEYILMQFSVPEDQQISINEGELYISATNRYPYRFVKVIDSEGKILFSAGKENNAPWDISTYDTVTEWLRLLEYAYDKVRTSMTSMDRFIEEFPPLGIV